MKYLFEEKKTKKVVELERDSITAGQMKEISRDGFRLIGIGGGKKSPKQGATVPPSVSSTLTG